MTSPLFIDTPDALDELADELADCDYIAVDTEFQREHTYYPHLALVQLACENTVACVDPVAFDAHEGLGRLLLDDSIIKVFHSCSQDLEVLHYYLGLTPVAIRDSQVARALLSEDQQISYAALVLDMLGIELDKSQTRTDWLRRPLTDRQLVYAADDVIYLYQLYPLLIEKLEQSGRMEWFEQDCSELCFEPGDTTDTDTQLWRRVRGSNRLKRNQLAIVQAVAAWREQIARERDRARRRVLADDIVIDIAISPPRDRRQLGIHLSKGRVAIADDQLDRLLENIDKTLSASPETWPNNRFQVLDGDQKQLLRKMQDALSQAAEELGIAPAMLYSRKCLERLLLAEDPENCLDKSNWRYPCIGEQLLQLIENR